MTANSTSSNDVSPLRNGDKIDKYVITEQIGAGGMSIVWKAHDPLLDRFVAIKQMTPPAMDRETMRERFHREADLQKRVSRNQKHLVQIYDMIEEPRGLFIVMEYVDGQSLEQMLASKPEPFDERQALGIVGAVALALDAIHSQGVIHRDLKPSNILIPKAGGLKVADFGLATLIDQQESMSVGSVRYMAPELLQEAPADARADIYSLGLISYEMLAGRAKFDDAFKIVLRDQRNQALRWMKWHTNVRAKAPPLNQLNPSVSSTLNDLVARMMEKDPVSRIPSATELLAAIRRHFTGGATAQPTVAGPVGPAVPTAPAERTAPLPTKSRLPVYLLAFLLFDFVAVVLGYVIYEGVTKAQAEQERITKAVATYKIHHATLDKAVAALKAYEDANPGLDDPEVHADYRQSLLGAKAGFDALAEDWSADSNIGMNSRACSAVIDADLQIDAKQYDLALASVDRADATNAFKDNRDKLQMLRLEINKRIAFEKSVAEIKARLGETQFAQARARITELRTHELNPSEKQRVDELGAQVEDQTKQYHIGTILDKAKDLVTAGDRDKAIELLTDAQAKYNNNPAIEKQLGILNEARTYDRAMADAAQVETRNNLPRAIDAYSKVLALRPDDTKVSQKIKELRSQDFRNKARLALQAGHVEEAQRYYTDSLIVENDEARKALSQIESTGQKSGFMDAGDKALAQNDFEGAMTQYDNALKFGPDSLIDQKISDIKFRVAVKQAHDLLNKNQLDAAQTALNTALALRPKDDEAKQVQDGIKRRQDYQKLLDDGDKARAASQFVDAKAAYRQAIKVAGNVKGAADVAQKRLDDTEFDNLMAQAKEYMETQRWTSARATLMTAQRIKDDSPEVKDLMAQVDEADPPKKKPSANPNP